MKTICAIDLSGSTGKYYFEQLRNYLDSTIFPTDTIWLGWGDYVDCYSKVFFYSKSSGNHGLTEPQKIIYYIQTDLCLKLEDVNLTLVTDGEINQCDINECNKVMRNKKFNSVDFIVISRDDIDLSVGYPFTKNSLNKVNILTNFQKLTVSTNFDYNSVTYENISDKLEELSLFIQLKYMSRFTFDQSVQIELNEIAKLKRFFTSKRHTNIASKDKKTILNDIQNISNSDIVDNSKAIKNIDLILNFIHQPKKNYKIIKLDKINAKLNDLKDVDESIPNVSSFENVTETFLDPITLDNETKPVILMYEYNLFTNIWETYNYSFFKNICECPLLLLSKIKVNLIGHVINFSNYKILNDTTKLDPMNRIKFIGGIIPYSVSDKYNDYIISKMFFNGKYIKYNKGFMYYILNKIIQSKNWIDENIKKLFDEYSWYRIENYKCDLFFDKYAINKYYVPIGLTCYYCAELSTDLYAESELFKKEKLREYCSVIKYMIDIAKKSGYEILNEENIIRRSKVFSLINSLNDKIPIDLISLDINDFIVFSYNIDITVSISPLTFRPKYYVDGDIFYKQLVNSITEISYNNNKIEYNKIDKIEYPKLISLFKLYIDYVSIFHAYPTLDQFIEYVHKKTKMIDKKIRIYPNTILHFIESVFNEYQLQVDIHEFIKITKRTTSIKKRLNDENVDESIIMDLYNKRYDYLTNF